MYDVNTHDVRRFFAGVWRQRLNPLALDALQQKALHILEAHPEHHPHTDNIQHYPAAALTTAQRLATPPPTLSLHLSIQEQAAIDQPPGIRALRDTLVARRNGDWVAAEHQMMEALAETIWEAQRYGNGLDVNAYITRLRRFVGLGQEETRRINPHEVPRSDKISGR